MEHLIHEDLQSEALEARFPSEISDIDLESYPIGVKFYKCLEKLFRSEAEFKDLKMHETEDVELLNYLREEADDPLLLVLDDYFGKFRTDLIEHILYEERKIFPLLLNSDRSSVALNRVFEDLDRHAHENEDELEMIMSVLEDRLKHQPESFGFGVLMTMLRQFLWDLQIHAQLEDELLIPRLREAYMGS